MPHAIELLRRLDWPARRPAHAPTGLAVCLLHQCRGDLLQLCAATDLSRAGQGGAPRPPAAPPREQRAAAQPLARGAGGTQEATPRALPRYLLCLVADVPHALG